MQNYVFGISLPFDKILVLKILIMFKVLHPLKDFIIIQNSLLTVQVKRADFILFNHSFSVRVRESLLLLAVVTLS